MPASTGDEAERRQLVPRRTPSSGMTGPTAYSSHARFFKIASRSFVGSPFGRELEVGCEVQHEREGAGTVTAMIDTASGRKAQVIFDNGTTRLFPVETLSVSQRPGSRVDDKAGSEPEEEEWREYDYRPGKDSLKTILAMVILGPLYEKRLEDGTYEYKRGWAYLNLLLLFVPLCFIANYAVENSSFTFVTCFFAIVPLAGLLGHFTEDLACHVGSALGALLNASFGNATEIIISVFAVKSKLFPVIKNSMLGSVMGNMLLVLGCAFLSRSLPNGTEERKKEIARSALWRFNAEAANVFASLLFLSSVALTIPTAFAQLHVYSEGSFRRVGPSQSEIFDVSRATAIAMILCYIAFLVFQVLHNDVFTGGKKDEDEEQTRTLDVEGVGLASDCGDDDDDERPKMTKLFDMGGLAVVTVLIAFVSEFLVSSLEDATESLGLSEAWVAVILLPIIGNAAEHATAILSAYKGDMEIAIGVAVGSSIQIAGFAVPVLVIISWIANGQNPEPLADKKCGEDLCPGGLDMNFHPFSMICMVLSVIVVNTIVTDGKGSWLEGLALLTTYAVVAIAFWYVPDGSDA